MVDLSEFSHSVGDEVEHDGKTHTVVSRLALADGTRIYNLTPNDAPVEGDDPPIVVAASDIE